MGVGLIKAIEDAVRLERYLPGQEMAASLADDGKGIRGYCGRTDFTFWLPKACFVPALTKPCVKSLKRDTLKAQLSTSVFKKECFLQKRLARLVKCVLCRQVCWRSERATYLLHLPEYNHL